MGDNAAMAEPRDPVTELREALLEIKDRNVRVEREKAWELSWTRRLTIGGAIYGGAWLWLLNLDVQRAPLQALVPAAAYVLSTLSLPIVKSWWLRARFK